MGERDNESHEHTKSPFDDIEFLDIPEELRAARRKRTEGERISDEVQEAEAFEHLTREKDVKQRGGRKLPAIIGIYLYPLSKPALFFLCVIFVVPLAMDILMEGTMAAMLSVPAFFVIWLLLFFVKIVIEFVLGLYLLWYYCQCIRDSAEGGIRAPETIANAPGLGEIFWQSLKFMICLVICFGPFVFYSYGLFSQVLDRTLLWGQIPNLGPEVMNQGNVVSLCLLIFGIFFLPMVLLSVVMFDSLWGFNPVLIIGSILSTFLQYSGLILICLAMWALLFVVMLLLRTCLHISVALNGFIGRCLGIYICLVSCHLIGRFYWRYEKKLNWDV